MRNGLAAARPGSGSEERLQIAPVRFLLMIAGALVVLMGATPAQAETWQAPVGGKTLSLDGRVVCPGPNGDWVSDGTSVKPPTDEASIGKSVDVHVAPSMAACANATTVTLVTTGKWPTIDPASVTLSVDDGRVEVKGKGLRGMGILVSSGASTSQERCLAPQPDAAGEKCVLPSVRGASADPSAVSITFLPAGGRAGEDVSTFDANGRRASASDLALRPARVLVSKMLPSDASLDVAGAAVSRIPLVHPEAVSSVDCNGASCEIDGGALVVRRLQTTGASFAVRFRLAPRVSFQKGDTLDTAPTLSIPLLSCALTVPSGEAIRGVDDAKMVVRLDPRCASDTASLRFAVNGRAAEVVSTQTDGGASLVLLRAGRIESDEVLVVATRAGQDASVVGQTRVRTRTLPVPRVSLVLDDGHEIDFVPENRAAEVRFVRDVGGGILEPLPIEGAVHVERTATGISVRADKGAGGFVALRFGYRVPTLPGALANVDLAVLTEAVQRPIKEAAVQMSLLSGDGKPSLVELLCEEDPGVVRRLPPGQLQHVPYASRDTCRLVLHRELIGEGMGTQRIALDIDVLRVDGSPRPEAHVSQTIALRAGTEPRVLYVKGATGRFDRVTIRLSQAFDDERAPTSTDAPSAQWDYVTGTEHARLYATTAIPTGLYRVSDRDHSGILTLNFGVVTRLTWLDAEGHEGFLGLEAGMMGVGLANDTSATGRSLTQAAVVTGLGLSVPIANRSLATETSINLHAWLEYEVSRALGNGGGSPFAFVFGPSISIGNVGTNL